MTKQSLTILIMITLVSISFDKIPINNTDSMNNLTEGIFPEPNQPPYFYAPLGADWVKLNDNWSIRLAEVLSDTRCPYGIGSCEESGKAIVKVQFMQPDVRYNSAYFETLEVFGLNRYPMPNGEIKSSMLLPMTINRTHPISNKQIGFKITLVDLRPYPEKHFTAELKSIKYIGLFHVEKL